MKAVLLVLSTILLFAAAQLSYLGCCQDNPDQRDLPILKIDPDDLPNSPETCVFLCGQDNWAYAGVQGINCYCGGVYGQIGRAAEEECNTPCPGDNPDTAQSPQICGGTQRNSVYATGVPPLQDSLDAANETVQTVVMTPFSGDTPPSDTFDPFKATPSGDLIPSEPISIPPTTPPTDSSPPKPKAPTTPNPPVPDLAVYIKCPICPYKHSECGGSTRGDCDRSTGICKYKNGWSGGACAGHNGKSGASGYRPAGSAVKCPICPYKAAECGGSTRGDCNKATGECKCKDPWSGGACSSRNGKPGAPGYRTPPPPPPPSPPKNNVMCPICPYKKEECGGSTRGTCNRNTGACECKDGWSGGACAGRNGKPGANGYRVPGASGGIKCPICPYKREECGGASRGACNSKTGECTCKAPYTGGACSNRPGHVGAPGYNLPKPKPKPVTQPPVEQVKCPICAFKGVECGGPTHGDCNTKSGDCACKTGYSGGACSARGDKVGDRPKSSGNHKCPICPYKREECGGATRGTCDRNTGNCACKAPYTGGACSNRPGHKGAPGYNPPRATEADTTNYSGTGSGNGIWGTAVAVLGAVVVVLFVVIIVLVVKLTAKEEERV